MSKYITQEDAEMEDTIKRSDVIDAVIKAEIRASIYYKPNWDRVKKFIADIPSADKQGHWIVTTLYVQGKEPKIAVRCSECKRIPMWLGSPILPTRSGNLDFCPHCGARMNGVDNESNADSNTINTLDALDSSEKPNNSDASKVKQVEKYPYNCNWDE